MSYVKRFLCFKIAAFRLFFIIAGLLFLTFGLGEAFATDGPETNQAATKRQASSGDNFFAVINGQKIKVSEFLYTFSKAVKEKFYHGKVSQEKLDAFKKEVAEKLVMETLLANEARKRGLRVDTDMVQKELKKYNRKLSKEASDKQKQALENYKKEVLPLVKSSIERQQLIESLEKEVKNIQQPSVNAVRAYYEANKKKFTAPQRWDVSIILLPVDPSASSEEWDQTVEKADQLLKKIHKGESFEELARIHSGDESAANGGHMGYMHIGMFGGPAQKVLNVMDVGEVSEPVVLLEGVAIFRLNGIEKAKLNPFDDVEKKARKLLMRELSAKAWEDFKVSLRKTAKVEYGNLFTPPPQPSEGQKKTK